MTWKINTTQSHSRRSKQLPVVTFLLVYVFLADNVWTVQEPVQEYVIDGHISGNAWIHWRTVR